MSGYIVRNPLMVDNPLRIQPPPEARPNVLAGPPQPNWAGAMDENARLYSEALARDRAEQVRLGYVDPATGKLTPEGWKQQAQIVGGGFGPADIGAVGIGAIKPHMSGKPTAAELQKWLEGSAYREPLFHGTKEDFGDFKANLTLDDHVPGVSVTPNRGEAASYGMAMPVYVRAQKPISYQDLEAFAAERAGKTGDPEFSAFDVDPHKLAQWLREAGHDAIDYTADRNLGYGIRVLDPANIRRVPK